MGTKAKRVFALHVRLISGYLAKILIRKQTKQTFPLAIQRMICDMISYVTIDLTLLEKQRYYVDHLEAQKFVLH